MKNKQKSICKTDHYGIKCWYLKGKRHREDGPSVEYPDGTKYWFLNGKGYTEDNYYKKLFKIGKITKNELFIHLI